MRRVAGLLAAIVLLGFVLFPAVDASAHAALITSEPANNDLLRRPPDRISLSFSEPLDRRSSGVRLLDANGTPIQLGAPEFSEDSGTIRVSVPNLDPGIYNVVWYNVSSVDGHGLRASYPFTVLNADGSAPDQTNKVGTIGGGADPPPHADGIAVRGLALLGLLAASAGALLVLLWPEASPGARRGFAAIVVAGSALLVLATLLNLQLLRTEYPIPLREIILETRFGGYWLTRLGAAFLVGITATLLTDSPRRAAAAVIGGVALSVWSFAATSHAAAGTGSNWGTGIDLLHGLAALLWIGAVVGFVFAARMDGRGGKYAALLPRFSMAASVLVFVLICTGILSSFVEIDKPARLTETRYGVTLLVKLGLMIPLLALGWYNAKRGKLSLLRPEGHRRFILTGGAEAILGILVFIPAAMLTQTGVAKSVPETSSVKPFNQETIVDDLSIGLAVDPARVGQNSYFVRLRRGSEPVAADSVRLVFRYLEDDTLGQSPLSLAKAGDGNFSAQGPYLTQQGRWRITVTVQQPDADDATAFFDVRPAGPAVITIRRGGGWDNPAPGLSWNEFGGFFLLMVAVGFAIWRSPLGALGKHIGWIANGMTVIGFALGTLLLFGVHRDPPPLGVPMNPIFPDENSIARGRELYQANCAKCHGVSGVPPKGLDLNPQPLDLTVHVPQHPSDGQLFEFIARGFPSTAMRAWAEGDDKLSDEQIWHIVNYLRTFGSVSQ
ncbi:hypothetical protein AYO38_00645 [bacterium SCGC AG-212-C10]|nr:hypothetical protein AYO38_00645 [bacterium SCGC AG-212-C10]